jgi:hypothetical protein
MHGMMLHASGALQSDGNVCTWVIGYYMLFEGHPSLYLSRMETLIPSSTNPLIIHQ